VTSIAAAFGCMPIIDGVSEIDPSCPRCLGSGSVCENHPHLPWGDLLPAGCQCGAAGMPCWEGKDRLDDDPEWAEWVQRNRDAEYDQSLRTRGQATGVEVEDLLGSDGPWSE
jgi:hypothetical protein